MTSAANRSSPAVRWARRVVALLLALPGLFMLAGGVALATEAGSLYYAIAGAAMAASAVLIWRGDRRGAWLYGALLAATLAWAVFEAGFDFLGLLPRLAMPVVLGLPLLWPALRGDAPTAQPASRRWPAVATIAGAAVLAVLAGSAARALGPALPPDPLLARGIASRAPTPLAQPLADIAAGDWRHYGNDAGGTRFSPLTDITPANVGRLQVAWEADVGPAKPGVPNALQVTPLQIGDALYVCNGHDAVIALDAETGQQRWRFEMTRDVAPSGKPCRGVSYYRVPEATGECSERIYAVSQRPELLALDARTGRPCAGFGEGGRFDVRAGMGDVPPGYTYISSALQVVRGKLVFGGAVMDGQYWGEPSGVIRAVDAVTGQLAWAFDVGRTGQRGAPPPGQTYTAATPNSWAPISADEALGLVYLPMGNATPDFVGAQRRPFDDEISSAVIALDADTGELRWRFSTVHHDLWDYDVPSQPTLVDLPTPTGVRRALIQPTKRGEVFVLDRVTGEPIKAVQERPTPQGGTPPGERLSPTQPFSVAMPSFRGRELREADMWGLTPLDQLLCRLHFRQSRYEGTLTPVGLEQPTILDPGYSGGINWGSVSVDVDRGLMLVNWMRVPSRVALFTREQAQERGMRLFDGRSGQGGGAHPQENTPYAAQASAFVSPLGIPCAAPPWGLLSAVDLVSGQLVWSQPLGNGRDSGPWGLRSHLPLTMGVPMSGGSLATRSGLVFVGATVDSMFRGFDSATGRLLWQASLPGAGVATPMSYRAPGSGRQFVVIAAGGRPALRTRVSTKIVAYALPP